MKKFIYISQYGNVNIVTPAPKKHVEPILSRKKYESYLATFEGDEKDMKNPVDHPEHFSISDEEFENHVKQVSIPDGVTGVRQIEESDIPAETYLRNAWVHVDGQTKLGIDIVKAKTVLIEQFKHLIMDANRRLQDATALMEDPLAEKQALTELQKTYANIKAVVVPEVGPVIDAAILSQLKQIIGRA